MVDKATDIWLLLLFGAGGIVILILAWVQPMAVFERLMTTFIGLIGPLGVLTRLLFVKTQS